jgi:hypothetical protein
VAAHDVPAVNELRRAWPAMTHAERREVLSRVIDAVFVEPGRAPVERRVTVCPAGSAPPPPRRGSTNAAVRRIRPRRGWMNPVKPTFTRPADPDTEPWVTQAEVAAHFGVTTSTIRRWQRHGMPSAKLAGRRRYRLSACQDWFDTRPTALIDTRATQHSALAPASETNVAS